MKDAFIVPTVKNQTPLEGELSFGRLLCKADEEDFAFAKSFLGEYSDVEFSLTEVGENVTLAKNPLLAREEYSLVVEDKIFVEYKDELGLRNALSSLVQLLYREKEGYSVRRLRVIDKPDCAYRSILLDLARGLPTMQRFKEDLKRIALAKGNFVHLHLMDAEGICYQSQVIQASTIRGTEPYTVADLKEIVRFCKRLGISVVPEIEVPAHATYLASQKPAFLCPVEVENKSTWTLCLGNEEVYALFERLIAEVVEIFPFERIHIGGDEHYFGDLPQLNRAAYWDICPVCKKKMEENALKSAQELFYYAVERMRRAAEKHGRKIILWNDEIDVSKEVDISRECIVQFWRIAHENRGPREGCSLKKLLERGFKVILSPFEYCYLEGEGYVNAEKTATFNYKEYGDCEEYIDQIIGVEACVWEYANPAYTYYHYSMPASSALLLAKAWDATNAAYDKRYRRALTKLLLGENTPKGYDVFELFGSILPPRKKGVKTYATIENELIDEETILRHKRTLATIEKTYGNIYLQELKELTK